MKDPVLSVKEKIGYGMGDGATLTIILALSPSFRRRGFFYSIFVQKVTFISVW
ncbi:TPA: hypothetical protein NPO92_003301 [Klebsiella quasipneumoniae subsp. quasipneumoniae]|nr:hypothetical protein [Klebsiella quasipneumoniae subsp. quasipneumoniae]